ncbi:MAG: hypothetical protein CMJ83_10030 [Planctomycetes bacterium]|nr:hypothetical protein [Planctomycetota bacterium]
MRGSQHARFVPLLLLLTTVTVPAQGWPAWDVRNVGQTGQATTWLANPGGGDCGLPIEMGDYDGDGLPDYAVAALMASSGPSSNRTEGGEVVVIRGSGNIAGSMNVAAPPPGQPLLTVYGGSNNDYLGTELASGDVTGDGVTDLVIGVMGEDPFGRSRAGEVIVVPGGPAFGGMIDMASPPAGLIRIFGDNSQDRLGLWVATGDLDGDGTKDIILGADQGDGPSNSQSNRGEVIVVFGSTTLPSTIDLRNPPAGVGICKIYGLENGDHLGTTMYGRDLDADGYEELIVAAAMNRAAAVNTGPAAVGGDGPNNSRNNCGDNYVLWGRAVWPASIDLQSPDPFTATNLTTIYGADGGDYLGEELKADDFDGDGFNDLALGALTSQGQGNSATWSGEAAIIYGGPSLRGQTLDMRFFPAGTSTIYGLPGEIAADSLAGTDCNGDGFADLAVGSPFRDVTRPSGNAFTAGAVDVIFGGPVRWPSSMLLLNTGTDVPDREIWGADQGDVMSYSMEAGDFDGDGFGDWFPNSMRGDGFNNAFINAGDVNIVSGWLFARGIVTLDALPRIGTSFGFNILAEPNHTYIGGFALSDSPGIPLPGGGSVALALDSIFLLSIDPLSPFFTAMAGTLDPNGQGQYVLNLPFEPGLVGTRLYTAFISINLGPGTVQTVSQTTSFVIEP